MPARAIRALVTGVVVGPIALVIGCGGPETGSIVKVDEAQEAKNTKAMEEYYTKKQAPGKSQGR